MPATEGEEQLRAEIARATAELGALPLTASNREKRLALNDQKLRAEAALTALVRRQELEREVTRLRARLAELVNDPASRPERARLSRELEAVERELRA